MCAVKTMTSNRDRPATRDRSVKQGLAALPVVMILFFVMAMVAAYTNRNLIFEQRISASSYQAARALQAAEAAQDWALVMLNAGRIDSNCQPSVDAANTDFRHRYLTEARSVTGAADGYSVIRRDAPLAQWLRPACVFTDDAGLACICPSLANPDLLNSLPSSLGSAFSVRFTLPGNAVRAGALGLLARGCANQGSGTGSCVTQTDTPPAVDALVSTQATLGLVRALPRAPTTALTANGAITGMGAANRPATSPWVSDEAGFAALFGMDRLSYRRQPAVVGITCNGSCTSSSLSAVLDGHPRNTLWVEGNLVLNTADSLGSAADPLMLIVSGTLTVAAKVQIFGFVHANGIMWAAGAEAAQLQGAMVSTAAFTATAIVNPDDLSYNRELLDIIHLRYGSFVRVPGSWNSTTGP